MDKRIENIKKQEANFDKLDAILNQLRTLVDDWESLQPNFKELMDYYGSAQWFEDVEASNKGEFKGIKAGILSEDAVYNLYSAQRTLNFKMIRTALDYLEK